MPTRSDADRHGQSETLNPGKVREFYPKVFALQSDGYDHTEMVIGLTDHLIVFDGWAKDWAEKTGLA